MATLRVPAAALRPGDVTLGSNQRIVGVNTGGIRIPTGKVEVITQRLDRKTGEPVGPTVARLWGRYTTIGVRRETAVDR